MRNIKFRALDKAECRWIYYGTAINGTVGYLQLKKETESQYTGLKDVNGVEIYEGDILSKDGLNYPVNYSWHEFNIDGYSNGDYYHGEDNGYHDWGSFEVIGNIYEHPELLK